MLAAEDEHRRWFFNRPKTRLTEKDCKNNVFAAQARYFRVYNVVLYRILTH